MVLHAHVSPVVFSDDSDERMVLRHITGIRMLLTMYKYDLIFIH
jgi:hypothetical protein